KTSFLFWKKKQTDTSVAVLLEPLPFAICQPHSHSFLLKRRKPYAHLHRCRYSIAVAIPSPPASPSSISFLRIVTSSPRVDAVRPMIASTTSSVLCSPRRRSRSSSTTSSVLSSPSLLDRRPLLDQKSSLQITEISDSVELLLILLIAIAIILFAEFFTLPAMDESISENVAGEAAAPGSNDAANPPASNESQSQTSLNVRGKTYPA
ncbi:hypothetical protein PIB30_093272, partial [Stylosanthes scabra]|nr:hypothetical protein [Stylosanthes scabra]